MFFVYLWLAWMVGCGCMAMLSAIIRKRRERNREFVRLNKENRRLKTVLEFYENVNEYNVPKVGRIIIK